MLHIIVPTCLADDAVVDGFLKGIEPALYSLPQRDCRMYLVINSDEDGLWFDVGKLNRGATVCAYLENRRIGYVGACNIGYRLADPADDDLVVILNDDLVFHGPWIEPLQAAIEDGAAVAGPSLKWVGRDGCWGHGDEKYQYLEGWCFATTGGVIRRAAREIRMLNEPKDWPRGPVMFDPQFAPAYCEDMDFCIRVQESGGKLAEVDVPVEHLHSMTYGTNRPSWARNREQLMQKWELG